MTELVFDGLLAALVLAAGAWSIMARQMMTAVIVFITYGVLLSLAWVRLGAVDVALTEAAIGSGVTGMLLIGAAGKLGSDPSALRLPSLSSRGVAALLSVAVAMSLGAMSFLLPEEPVSLAGDAMRALPESGLGNPVAGVLFVFRAFDTLLEKIVLLLALLGVWSLAKDEAWGGIPGLKVLAQPGSVLPLLARTLPPLGLVFGIYMTWAGADVPGGAFQGGTVLAAMWILIIVAGLARFPPVGATAVRLAVAAGPAVFLLIGFAGFLWPGLFLAYPEGYAKPLIVVMELALTLSIAVILGLLAAGPPQRPGAQ
ncbi:hydrogenase subunit MbhD domain-containing protein [Aestuariivirga sp.]|uniref:hydrogenase subunit MbhD domain-containing protein n=1 Tax=Aestuariivirga sp. TaxID=2650926 RepID=UPI00391B39AD